MADTRPDQPDQPRYLLDEQEREAARERSRKRAERQVEEREHLRLEIESRWHIQQVADILRTDYLEAATGIDKEGNPRVNSERARLLIQEAKLKLDGHMRMLQKVLPDLKTVELDATLDGDADVPPLVQIVSYDDRTVIRTHDPRGASIAREDDDGPAALEDSPPWLM